MLASVKRDIVGAPPASPISGAHDTVPVCAVDGAQFWRSKEDGVVFSAGDRRPSEETRRRGAKRVELSIAMQGTSAWLDGIIASIEAKTDTPAVLEIGLGLSFLNIVATHKQWRCFGVDSSEELRTNVRSTSPSSFVVDTIEDLPPYKFDLVLLVAQLELLSDPYPFFFTLMSKGGIGPDTTIVIVTPDGSIDGVGEDFCAWLEEQAPHARMLYTSEGLTRLLQRLRFSAVTVSAVPAPSDKSHDNTGTPSLLCIASGSDFAAFMQERYIPGTWSELAQYEHLPRYTYASNFVEGRRVLDFGCGSGYGAALLAETAAHVTALDISSDALAWARETHKAANIDFIKSSDFGAALPSNSFDAVTCFEVIEHLDVAEQNCLLAALARLLKPDGVAIISTPNPEVTALYGDNPYHLHEMNRAEFASALNNHFTQVALLNQSVHPAVFIIDPDDGLRSPAQVREIMRRSLNVARPAAFLGVCSNGRLPALMSEVHWDVGIDYPAMRVKSITHPASVYELQLHDEILATRALSQERNRLEEEREQALLATRALSQERDRLEEEREQALAELEQARNKLATAEIATADIEHLCQSLHEKLNREISDAAELRRNLLAIETSNSWRFMKKMHPAMRLVRRAVFGVAEAVNRLLRRP